VTSYFITIFARIRVARIPATTRVLPITPSGKMVQKEILNVQNWCGHG